MADAVVTVRGCANADVDPEVARVVIGISAHEQDRLAAVEALAKADAAVWAVLTEFPGAVERSRSDGVRVWGGPGRFVKAPSTSQPDDSESDSGRTKDHKRGKAKRQKHPSEVLSYTANVWYEITIGDFTVLDELVSALADQQAVELAGPSWGLRANSGVYRKLRGEATRRARALAEELAEAAGGALSGLIELTDASEPPACEDAIVLPPAGRSDHESRLSWVIQPARQSVSVAVDARFRMTQPYFP